MSECSIPASRSDLRDSAGGSEAQAPPTQAGALSWIPCLGTRAPVRMGSSQTNKHKNLTLSFISQTHHAITLIAFTTGDVTFVMFLGLKLCPVRTGTRAVLLTACSFPLCLEGPAMHWGLLPKT